MKKLNTKSVFADTRINIEDEDGNTLCTVDYLSFAANKMAAKLFAGQLVNAWNKVYSDTCKCSIINSKSIEVRKGGYYHCLCGKKISDEVLNAPATIKKKEPETRTIEAIILAIDHAIEQAKSQREGAGIRMENYIRNLNYLKTLALDKRPEFDPTYIREDKAQPE